MQLPFFAPFIHLHHSLCEWVSLPCHHRAATRPRSQTESPTGHIRRIMMWERSGGASHGVTHFTYTDIYTVSLGTFLLTHRFYLLSTPSIPSAVDAIAQLFVMGWDKKEQNTELQSHCPLTRHHTPHIAYIEPSTLTYLNVYIYMFRSVTANTL